MSSTDPGMGLVIVMGLGTVFIGLICIIIICYIMGAVIKVFEQKKPAAEPKTVPAASTEIAEAVMPEADKGELIAAISAAIAEELGEDVEAFRIKSIKRVS